MMGLEEHLIGMFRHDFEFVDGHRSHLGDGAPAAPTAAAGSGAAAGAVQVEAAVLAAPVVSGLRWSADGEAELAKIPFFVRGKVRKNTEAFARERGLAVIDSEALYEAKAHFS
jgi:light-independent protochlorophyllide reductase subunit B